MNPNLGSIAPYLRTIGEHLVNGLTLSAAIFLGSMLLLRLLFCEQRWSASTRHRVSLLTFFVLASTPILTALKPVQPRGALSRAEQSLPVQAWSQEIPVVSGATVSATANHSASQHAPRHRWRGLGFWFRWVDWALAFALLWAMLVMVCLVRLALAINRLRLLHRSAKPLTVPTGLTLRRKITVAESSQISSPVAVGLWSAKVLLPTDFTSRFSAEDQENVLRHEIAHLERYDDWSSVVQLLVIALFPINPFLWILDKRLQLQQEVACDDWALAGVHHPKNYANLLARLAANRRGEPLLVSGVSRDGKQLYQRVSRILDKNCNRSLKPSWWSTLLAGVTLVCSSAGALVFLPAVVWTQPAQAAEAQNGPAHEDSKPAPLSSEVIALLKNSALNDVDAGVRREAVNALSNAVGDEATTALLTLLDESKDEQVKVLVLHRLKRERVAEVRVKEKLNDLATHEQSIPIRIAALSALSRNIDDNVVEKFIAIYRSAGEAPIKETCLWGLAGASSKTAQDFLMSVAKDDPDAVMRRLALRAVSDSTGKGVRVMVRTNRAMIGGQDLDDLGYISSGQIPDGPDEMVLNPRADRNELFLELPDNLTGFEKEKAEVLKQRMEQLKERIHVIPFQQIPGEESESHNVPMTPERQTPSNKPSGMPLPQPSSSSATH